MKGKALLSLAIALAMLLSAMPLAAHVKAQDQVKVEVIFVENGLSEITKAPGAEFRVAIRVSLPAGVTIDFCDMEIHWNPAVVELKTGTDADVTEGPWMKSFGTTVFVVQNPDNAAGILPDIACGYLTASYASGSGDFCYIDFRAKAVGDSLIEIWTPNEESFLLHGLDLVTIEVVVNGVVHVPPPPATAPKAIITSPTPGQFIPVCTDVELDGSASTAGYDTLPAPGHTCPIVDYIWDIDIDNDGSIDFTLHGATASFHCDGPGAVGITLTVYAPDPTPPTAPDYVETNSVKIVVYQVAPALGPQIDVYTDRGGEGILGDFPYPYGWSDAYGPQEMVCVFAKVTYNEEPVEYKPVGFELIDPSGESRDYRVVFTDENGIATYCFRIPWQGSNAEDYFGNWSIVGTVDIAETIVTDTVMFKFGYILSIVEATVSPFSQYKLNDITIDVTVHNIAFSSYDAFLTIVAYDNCQVPIGKATAYITADPEVDTVFPGFTITIPKWAFVGTAALYVNLFTAPPKAGGVPYCPEYSTTFTILKTP